MIKRALSFVIAGAISFTMLAGCSTKTEKRIKIWTDNSEFAPYIELFNETHKQKAVLIYKANPAASLPAASDEIKPDLVIGSWLKNNHTKKYFKNVEFLFDRQILSSKDFYPALLDSGVFSNQQYLIPVSFNIPCVIFSKQNEHLIEDKYTINLETIKKIGGEYNKKDKKGNFTKIGFAPSSSDNFLYLACKILGSEFKESKNSTFTWNNSSLTDTLNYLSSWTTENNGSSQIEQDFVFKYLSETDDKRAISGKTLFVYTTSDKLFKFSQVSLSKIDYRWIEIDNMIPIEDSMTMLGISKDATNLAGATEFIEWFYNPKTQEEFLERKIKMHLDSTKFGISDGFSAVKEVNEHIMPVYYKSMLSNIPQSGSFKVYERKPVLWERIKKKIIIPYIKEKLSSNEEKRIATIEERYSDWKKQGFN